MGLGVYWCLGWVYEGVCGGRWDEMGGCLILVACACMLSFMFGEHKCVVLTFVIAVDVHGCKSLLR